MRATMPLAARLYSAASPRPRAGLVNRRGGHPSRLSRGLCQGLRGIAGDLLRSAAARGSWGAEISFGALLAQVVVVQLSRLLWTSGAGQTNGGACRDGCVPRQRGLV